MKLLRAGARTLGISLSNGQMQQFQRYFELLADWNSRVNLTAVTGWEEVQATHFLDSLTVSLAIPEEFLERGKFVDVGTGAGFPGVPLKIAYPGLRATLIESTAKKAVFLEELARDLGMSDLDVRTGRSETLAHDPALRERFDFVLIRAVAKMAALAELTLPFCRLGGIVIAQKKTGVEEEIRQSLRAIEVMGGELREVREVTGINLDNARCLIVVEKRHQTPDQYPRRAGMPAKRPL